MPKGFSKSYNLTKEIILTLAKVGCFAIAATSPYFFHHLINSYFAHLSKQQRYRAAERMRELQKKKIVSVQELANGSMRVELTNRGKDVARQYNLETISINKQKKWDGKWRLVIYDIPHHHKKARDAFRGKLKQLGLYNLQKSVWVSAYDCLPELEFLCGVFEIDPDRHLVYLTLNSLNELPRNQEKELKRWFNLV
jgi:DNA-binding transcriptional regulator PaaX